MQQWLNRSTNYSVLLLKSSDLTRDVPSFAGASVINQHSTNQAEWPHQSAPPIPGRLCCACIVSSVLLLSYAQGNLRLYAQGKLGKQAKKKKEKKTTTCKMSELCSGRGKGNYTRVGTAAKLVLGDNRPVLHFVLFC